MKLSLIAAVALSTVALSQAVEEKNHLASSISKSSHATMVKPTATLDGPSIDHTLSTKSHHATASIPTATWTRPSSGDDDDQHHSGHDDDNDDHKHGDNDDHKHHDYDDDDDDHKHHHKTSTRKHHHKTSNRKHHHKTTTKNHHHKTTSHWNGCSNTVTKTVTVTRWAHYLSSDSFLALNKIFLQLPSAKIERNAMTSFKFTPREN
ncbi:hypothetical protein BDF20DRAFT_832436 [Mycotypha africana]|uniref:uncharacterized protein n=1 Tax=Mycotypha africana TaxID=64632 RepID=UPI002301CA1D|nr:uncharacterized protein BDF20DRAFT_832436 [Mycotypha africana]KAI8987508.1 hypothetical protein BDF20DRAFT_832436 [Mycotypha africana]